MGGSARHGQLAETAVFFAQKVLKILKISDFQEEKKSENLVSRKDNIEFINQSTKCVKFVPKD